ncbi:alanine--tRNA ligase [Buchnera aphidicola]|uniref:alanine--tRNA ligase n=1 Tax=Buchnera aphidicola TaxID=9 RepID=UPI003464CB7C
MNKKTIEIRKQFLHFFHKKKHKIIPGSSLIPQNDSSLLFTNAGMNQFKDIFLGNNKSYQYSKIATAQYCLRTGGKHNDLENVGYSSRHHTFFEMLGNFSFGDYFKKKAILYSWELLTSKKWFALPKDNFLITVYKTDEETYDIWANVIGIPLNRIILIGNKTEYPDTSDNFWQMGDTGPCGPCTEIFYNIKNNLSSKKNKNSENIIENYIEIWNIVFMQFNRINDHSLLRLPNPSVDTGMGLERISSIINDVSSNYDIDIFQILIKDIAKITNTTNLKNKSLYIIADHIRACYFMIAENILPSNENRGYVLRRIIRRAVRHGYLLGVKTIFLYKLVTSVNKSMNINNIHLLSKKENIENILKVEEIKFNSTLERGLQLLDSKIKTVIDNTLDGEIVFYLYDTFGFPIDLTEEVCREHNIRIDYLGFKKNMDVQKNRSREKKIFNTNYSIMNHTENTSIFVGYNTYKVKSFIENIFINGKSETYISSGEKGIILLKNTPFYPESGGQVGDIGIIHNKTGTFKVEDTKKNGKIILHIGILLSGMLEVKTTVFSEINTQFRSSIKKNHSAIHLLSAALKKKLGNHVYQNGSLVTPDYIRFDFFHNIPIPLTIIQEIEQFVNQLIRRNILIKTEIINFKDAKKRNITFLSNKKYDKYVRTVSINHYSNELCGGTHTDRTGDIGFFKIKSERSISSNIHRVEAITGRKALDSIHIQEKNIYEICTLLKTNPNFLKTTFEKITLKQKNLEKNISELKEKNMIIIINELTKKITKINHVILLIDTLNNQNTKTLRNIMDRLKSKFKYAIIILANIINNKVTLIVGITKNLTQSIQANQIMHIILKKINGKGGGKVDIAEGGSIYIQKLPEALSNIKIWINSIL